MVLVNIVSQDSFRMKPAQTLYRRISDTAGADDAYDHIAKFPPLQSRRSKIAMFYTQYLRPQLAKKGQHDHHRVF